MIIRIVGIQTQLRNLKTIKASKMIKISSAIFKTFFLSLCIVANTHFAFGQTASILPPGYTQYLDSNGKPLSAGKVYNYIPSTTTPKTTWQDAAETIPNANPVILDAGGRAKILGDGSYRQIVKDRNNVTIWDAVTSSTGSGSSSSTATGDGDLVGTIKPWAGIVAPNQYAFAYGQEISRTTYSVLYAAITSTQPTFCTSGSPTLTGLSDTTNFWIGMSVEVTCLAAGYSTIVSKTSSSVTLAANANVSTNANAIFYPWGRGNGTTTFNLPDLRGVVLAGNNNMGGVASANLTTTYFGSTNPNSIGAIGGNQSSTLTAANMPGHNHAVFLNDPGHNHTTDAKTLPGGAAIQSGTGLTGGSAVVNSNTTGITIRDTSSGFGTANQTNYTGGGIAVSATLGNTGSGYTNGSQTITVIGGTCTTQPQFTVNVSGNVFTGTPSLLTAGSCTVAPANPASTTGGGGTGGTLNVSYSAQPISIVQPTRTTNYIIKITPDTNSASASGVTSLGGMTGDIACGSGLTCTGNTITATPPAVALTVGSTAVNSGTSFGILWNNGGVLANTAAGTSGYALIGNGASAPTFQGFVGYTAGASNTRTWQAKAQDVFSIMDYAAASGCVADATADCSTAINAAVQAAFDYASANPSGNAGTVYVPPGANCYRIATTITMLRRVNIVGAGSTSCILADNVNALTFGYISGYGQARVSNLFLKGANSTAARYAITRPGSLTNADIQYGLDISNVLVRDFDTAVYIKTVQNLWITNSWFENINQCISLNGFTAVINIQGTRCIKAAGGGVGATTGDGIGLYQFNYTTSGGLLSPEGALINQTQIFGFDIGFNVDSAVYTVFQSSDISSPVTGIRYNDARGGLYINNNYIAITSATGAYGINGVALGGGIDQQVNIYSNTFISTTSAISVGIRIEANQRSVNISKNLFDTFAVRDIQFTAPFQCNIDSNRLRSTGTDSINLAAAGGGICLINNNETALAIVANATDITNGIVRKSNNIVGGVREAATWAVETNATTANRLMLGGGAGVQPTAAAAGTTTTVWHGNAAGAGSYGAVVSADLNITTTSCSSNFVTAISSGAVGTCSTLGANVFTFLNTPSSANLAAAVTDETGTGALVFGTSPTFTTSILLPAGAAATPSATFSGDTNNGWWSPAADTQAWSTAGSERMRITSAGDVGIGITSPSTYKITNQNLAVGGDTVNPTSAQIAFIGNQTIDGTLGDLTFHNAAIGSGTKRVGFIRVRRSGADDSGQLQFWTYNASTPNTNMTIEANRQVTIPGGTASTSSTTGVLVVTGGIGVSGALWSGTYIATGVVAVASLPACGAGIKGGRMFVNNATATTFASTVAGGGANNVPVVCDGTNWIIG